MSSSYYDAFIKFGKHVSCNAITDSDGYFEFLVKNSVKLDRWTWINPYKKFLKEKYNGETAESAAERLVLHLEKWRMENDEESWSSYFKKATDNLIYDDIKRGIISPWVYLCHEPMKKRIKKMPEEMVMEMISETDMDFWERKMDIESMKWIRKVLS